MDQRTRQWAFLLGLSVTLGTAVVAGTAVYAIRQVLRQDLVDSAEAQSVIRVAKLHALAERLGGHARGFLLTGDPVSFQKIAADRQAFFGRLDMLLQSASAETRQRLEDVRGTAREYDEALDAVIGLRLGGRTSETVVNAFEERVRPRKEILDQALATLIQTEELRLDSLDRLTERSASRLATAATGVAVGALLVSLALAVLLARAFQSLRRKKAELETALGRVEQINQDLDAFAGRIAHDLRTPLTPITLMAQHLQRFPDEKVTRAAERIERGAKTANRMLEGLLAFSRLGQRSEGVAAFGAPIVRETLEDFSEKLASAQIAVDTYLEEDASVACSAALFSQLVGNLVGNAIKFMDGRVERRLRVDLRTKDESCELEVLDTGPGIPPEALGRIFDPFYRVPGAAAPGAGLGLAIVWRIVEAHDGTVAAISTVGRGTTFRVVLPTGRIASQSAGEMMRSSVRAVEAHP
jgi:signal transduction histidine kinase